MTTSELAHTFLPSLLGRPLAGRDEAAWIQVFCADGDRPRLFDFEPSPGKPCVPGLGEGAGGWRATIDLAEKAALWIAENVQAGAAVTVQDLEDMKQDLSPLDTWLCNPVIGVGDWRLEILEA